MIPDLCEWSNDDCECDPELDLVLDKEVNGSVNGDSVGVNLSTCVEGLEHLADIIIPQDHAGDGPEIMAKKSKQTALFRARRNCLLQN